MTKVLVSITTCSNNWQDKIKEAKKLKLTELAFFPTCLRDKKTRLKAYKLLENTSIKNIPFVHLRGNMDIDEIEYLIKRFNTKVFNIHSKVEHAPEYDLSKYKNEIYVENHPGYTSTSEDYLIEENMIKKYAGICLDISHLEADRLEKTKHYSIFLKYLKKYKCGVWHMSAITSKRKHDSFENINRFDHHTFKNLSEFNYLKKYKKFLPKFIALEVENNIAEQLGAKKYIEKLLGL